MFRRVTVAILCCSMILTSAAPAFAAEMKRIPNTKVYADKQLVEAFDAAGFTLRYQKNMDYAGIFSMNRKEIVLKYEDKNNTLHELGHFLSRLEDNAAQTKKFISIYSKEKKNYRGTLKSYVTQSSSEYFAQSYSDYHMQPKNLKKQRPKTYSYIKNLVRQIEENDVERLLRRYKWPD